MKPTLVRVGFKLERFWPQLIKYYLNSRLKQFKRSGVLADYKVKAKRAGKYHYLVELDLSIEQEQLKRVGGELFG